MKNKNKKVKKENSERWLLTYSDLITLLMILFILLYAISAVDEGKYQELSDSLNVSLGDGSSMLGGVGGILQGTNSNREEVEPDITDSKDSTITPLAQEHVNGTTAGNGNGNSGEQGAVSNQIITKEDMNKVQERVKLILKELNLEEEVSSEVTKNGLTISFSNKICFDSGEATLKEELKNALNQISSLLKLFHNPVIVEGHTDNVPVSNNENFASNWQLSSVRAANVVYYLVNTCNLPGDRLSAVGYGEFKPKASNNTESGRRKNRRIDLVIPYLTEEDAE